MERYVNQHIFIDFQHHSTKKHRFLAGTLLSKNLKVVDCRFFINVIPCADTNLYDNVSRGTRGQSSLLAELQSPLEGDGWRICQRRHLVKGKLNTSIYA